ncbi:MAG: methylhydantoinase [Candidatus Nephthysia bennettiae]|nr:hydantoinase/oxoprolinase family protein [Candidatus Dormibacteraeota bacterium]PZR98145.1 MAG: methylhydantoinase [Candidatus Dormibacteraeota bacterium]
MRLAAVDVGGTFTDLAVWDETSATVRVHKLLTTPDDPTEAVMEGLRGIAGTPDSLVHGTTLVTNAIIERRGARTGLVTTEGYRDTLEISTELRYDTFDLGLRRPEPLVPRPLRLAVAERVGADGTQVSELDETAVRDAARRLAASGVEAVAVAFFNSYRNPSHEQRALEILREELPGVAVCASAEIAPEIREYERFSTAVANAYVQPLASRYLRRLAEEAGAPLLVMLSDGGITSAGDAARRPITLVESGPAAGAMAGGQLAQQNAWKEAIAFDMGGTTAKISLIHDGVPHRSHEIEVARLQRFKKGSGLPLRLPVVNLIEIGAGGGSIASAENLGLLKVGPRSAGAIPGPACYGLGGREATVTDADLHLGYLSPDGFLGGRLRLDRAAADAALDRLAAYLGIGRTAAAAGIVQIVDNNMATAARIHIAEQGRDPRRYRLIAFGGAGPVHAHGLARLLHVGTVVFPRAAGVASAVGMLVAPRSVEHTRGRVSRLDRLDWDEVAAIVSDLRTQAAELMRDAGADAAEVGLELSADMRYAGQGYEVTVPLEGGLVERRDTSALHAAFEAEYRRRFDRSLGELPAEVVSWRLRAHSPSPVGRIRFESEPPPYPPRKGEGDGGALTGERPVYFPEVGEFQVTPVHSRALLRPGAVVRGPAIVEEAESTVVAGPGATLESDAQGNLVMRLD